MYEFTKTPKVQENRNYNDERTVIKCSYNFTPAASKEKDTYTPPQFDVKHCIPRQNLSFFLGCHVVNIQILMKISGNCL